MESTQSNSHVLGEYSRIFYGGRWIIWICLVTVVAAVVYYNVTTIPVYEASALILIKKESTLDKTLFDNLRMGDQATVIYNHTKLLKSRTLIKEVIQNLQSLPQADSLYFLKLGAPVERFSIMRWILNAIGFKIPPSMVQPSSSLEELIEKFRKSSTVVLPRDKTDILELRVKAYSPHESALLANTWMETYQAMDIRESRGEITEVREFLEGKIKEIQATLSQSEEALKEYKKLKGVTELNTETEQLIRQLAEFETEYEEARIDLQANERRLAYLKSELDESQRAIIDEATHISSPVIMELQRQMAQLMAEKAAYEEQLKGAGYRPDKDARLRTIDQRLKGLQESIVEETKKLLRRGGSALNPLQFSENLLNEILQIEAENKALKAKAETLSGILQRYNQMLNMLPEKSLQLARFQREAEVNNNIFLMLREKFEESRISEAGRTGSIRIVDYADPPLKPIRPKKTQNLILGILCGFGLGISILFLKEHFRNTLQAVEDVEQLGFPVLGSIPVIPARGNHKKRHVDPRSYRIESRLITHWESNSAISEAYRTVRTNVLYANGNPSFKTILVTSPGPGEGKSTSAANLAITFAQMGANTLLIDTDLRRPVLHNLFDLEQRRGLTQILVRRLSIREAIQPTHVQHLYVLPSGPIPKSPSEFLASKTMRAFVQKVSHSFDLILLDSPPVIPVTDACVLASYLDGVLLVVYSERTDREAFLRSTLLLKHVDAHILGVLVNRMDITHRYGSYYRRYYTKYYTSYS